MTLRRTLKGTALETPARKLRDTLIGRRSKQRIEIRERTPAELRVLACATNPTSQAENPSIFFFTTHKCASTFVTRILSEIGQTSPRAHFDYAGAIYRLGDSLPGKNPYSLMALNFDHLFFPESEVYGPMRNAIPIENPGAFRMIFFLRDPRDVLVSAYYSFGFSHGIPKNSVMREKFLERRQHIQNEGIDRYVIRAASDWLAPLYKDYATLRQRAGDNLYIRYDDYTADPKATIGRIFDFCDSSADAARITELAEAAKPIVATDGGDTPLRHKRSGRSGQFRSELAAETVARLDEIFSETLEAWDFPR